MPLFTLYIKQFDIHQITSTLLQKSKRTLALNHDSERETQSCEKIHSEPVLECFFYCIFYET